MASTRPFEDLETFTSLSRITKEGEKITYRMNVVQHPIAARAYGSGAKSTADRCPVEPPPVIKLRVFQVVNAENDITFSYNATLFLFADLELAYPIRDGHLPLSNVLPILTGITVSGTAYLDRLGPACYFIFPDLSVRNEGKYRLSFSLFEQLKEEKDADSEVSQNSETQKLDHFWQRLKVKSLVFTSFSAKKYLGLAESTPVSRILANQGCRIRIRRDVHMRRWFKPGGKFEEGEDDSIDNQSKVAAILDYGSQPVKHTTQAVHEIVDPEKIPESAQQSAQVDANSDAISDVSSEAESLASIAVSTISSMTSVHDEISNLAVGELVDLLLADEELKTLYVEAIRSHKVSPDRFQENLRRLLNQYSVDLQKEAENDHQKPAVYLIRSRLRFIANDIHMKLSPSEDDNQFKKLKARSDSKLITLSTLEDYLRDSGRTTEVETSALQKPSTAQSDSDDEGLDDGITEIQQHEGLPRLEMVKEFMVSITAFAGFRKILGQFVHKDFNSKVRQLVQKLSKTGSANSISQSSTLRLKRLVLELECTASSSIIISHRGNQGLCNWLKSAAEELTGQSWDWWPFSSRKRRLSHGEARLC